MGLFSTPRVLAHIDLTAFYASVEQLRNPRLQDRPVAVGHDVLISFSYEAQSSGAHPPMTEAQALKLCPQLLIVPENRVIYRAFEEEAFRLCTHYSPRIETYPDRIDCDLTGTRLLHKGHVRACRGIQRAFKRRLGVSVTMGLASNRAIAKLAAEAAGSKGIGVIPQGDEADFIAPLPIENLPGLTGKQCVLLKKLNIHSVKQLRCLPPESLVAMFGPSGRCIFQRCQGRESPPVRQAEIPNAITRCSKLPQPRTDPEKLEALVRKLSEAVAKDLRKLHLTCRHVTVGIKYTDHRRKKSSTTLRERTSIDDTIFEAALPAYRSAHRRRVSISTVCVTLKRLASDPGFIQLPLNDQKGKCLNRHALMRAKDSITNRWGSSSLISGRCFALDNREDSRPSSESAPD